jgi:uncharacterized protein YdcH (DUF465 family)
MDIHEQLLASDETFRKLANEHALYSQRLDNLNSKRYLSEEEKLEEVRLKKLKLKLKDEMSLVEHQYSQHANNVA